MKYDEWVSSVPVQIREDAVWRVEAYRLALFMADIGWHDITKLMRDRRTLDLATQLYRAIGSVSANIAEGFSRNSPKEKARFYEYALGSARESRDWYYKGRHILETEVTAHRIETLTRIIRLLLTMIPDQRERALKEATVEYEVIPEIIKTAPMPDIEDPNRRTSADPIRHTSLITYHASPLICIRRTTQ
jgi:four helix bundle protein